MEAIAATSGQAAPAYVGARRTATVHAARLTNFYPLYDGANDQVDRVLPVRRTIFQRIFPRYELSTSETRDQGLGPSFIEIPDWESPAAGTPAVGQERALSGTDRAAPAALLESPPMRPRAPLPAGQGQRIDILV